MKFQKFVKSIGSEGIIYERKNGERWLASDNVFMRIPKDIRSITASEIAPIPEAIENEPETIGLIFPIESEEVV